MNREIALLALVTVALTACVNPPQQQGRPAPVEDLATGPSGKQPKPPEPKAAPSIPVPQVPQVPQASKHQEPSGAGAYLEGDGPGPEVPANLDAIPDAVPKAEPLHRYANLPYTRFGKTYTPLQTTGSYKEEGTASWYGKKFHGQRTSIGDVYDMYGMTASHTTLPVPSYARITNLATKKSVIVRVNDRGPFLHDRIIDLSYVAAHKLGIINNGTSKVLVESIAVDNTAAPLTVSAVASSAVKAVPLPVLAPASAPVMASAVAAAPAVKTKPIVAENVYLQLGAFKSENSAKSFMDKLRSKLGASDKSLSLFQKDKLQQVLLGPYATTDEASAEGKKIKAKLGINTYISVRN